MKMTTNLRTLLRKPAALQILQDLWNCRNEKNIKIYLATTENCINKCVNDGLLCQNLPNDMLDICYGKFDAPFFSELKFIKVMKLTRAEARGIYTETSKA